MIVRKPKYVQKVWGHEEWTHNSELYCGKLLYVNHGAACSLHYHIKKTETFTVVRGRVKLEMGDNPRELETVALGLLDTVMNNMINIDFRR